MGEFALELTLLDCGLTADGHKHGKYTVSHLIVNKCIGFWNDMNEEIVIFRTNDESINVEVRFEDETAWLTQDQMSVLFSKSKSTINEHIKNIFQEGELVESQVMRKFGNSEFTHNLTKMTNFYNLDVIY